MIDGPSEIDPLVAEGPLAPVNTLRPAANLQRVLLLDQPGPFMADLATGDIRRYENGPPVSVPMVSNHIDFAFVERLQVQVLRDPRPTSAATTLLSLHLGDADVTIDVVEHPSAKLQLLVSGAAVGDEQSGPVGVSPAVVVVIERTMQDGLHRVSVTARNAESMDTLQVDTSVSATGNSMVTVGGPTTKVTGAYGRRRLVPVLIELTRPTDPADQVRRVVRGARRAAGAIRNRMG